MDELSTTVGKNNATDLPDDLVEDETFSLDGYQVVRGEFFGNTYEPQDYFQFKQQNSLHNDL